MADKQSLLVNEADADERDVLSDHHISIIAYVLFVIFSAGSSWVLCDAIFIELPYFEQYQPEGDKMVVAGAVVAVTLLPLYLIIQAKINPRQFSLLSNVCVLVERDGGKYISPDYPPVVVEELLRY